MLKVGLTGGIGCGKSTAVDAFRALGAPIIDADQIAREVVEPGHVALDDIAASFGGKILLDTGGLNRPLLKQLIFSDSAKLKKLEAILHPRIRDEIDKQILSLSEQPYVIVDIPLLVEKGYQNTFDRIIVVDCTPEQQMERVNNRDGMDKSEIKVITKAQATRQERLNFATDILDNTGNVDTLRAQIIILHKTFLQRSHGNI